MFIGHEPCPKCGSKDNLARYSDGSSWCFGCGSLEKANRIPTESRAETRPPPQLVKEIPKKFLAYYAKFDISPEDVEHYFEYWPSQDRVVYTVGEFWEARSVDKSPKTLSYGPKPFHMLRNMDRQDVCIVEDIVSAIKVSKVCTAMPLFGSALKSEYLQKLLKQGQKLYIWLDADKIETAFKMAQKVGNAGRKATVVFTQHDPKVYSTEEIEGYLK